MNATLGGTSLRERTAEEIRVHLARRNISAAELARRTGMKQPYISRRMTGEVAWDIDDLERIAYALNVEVIDLLPAMKPGRLVTTGAAAAEHDQEVTRQYPAPAKSTGPNGHPNRTLPKPSTRRPARIGAALAAA